MTHFKQLRLAVLLAALGAPGCSAKGDEFKAAPPFENEEDVATWAVSGSALGVYSTGYTPIGVADGKASYDDSSCPALSDDGTTLTITGDCVDDRGKSWKGTATVQRDGDDRLLTLDDFEGVKGTISLHQSMPGLHEFEAHFVAGEVTTVDYIGSVSGDYGMRTVWNGSGKVERDGFISPNGKVNAATQDEVVDDSVCSGQPVSGTTMLASGTDKAVITYDGESDCDSKQNAQLSVNGEDRGLIQGITCSVGAPGAAGDPASAALFSAALAALSGLAVARRRRSPQRPLI
jgi:hypothetical protein